MEALASIFEWLREQEGGFSAVAAILVIAGVVFAGFRWLLSRRGETSAEKAPAASGETPLATDSSPADLDPLTVPGFEGRPAIAVLAFDNLSGDPDQEHFADGIAEDLIIRLSRWRWFPVIARNSSFTYKGKPVDVKQVSRELGARYVVEGSVRQSASRVRLAAQLIDATTGHHLWAETYDRGLQEIFDIQDEIAQAIACSVEPALEKSEWKRTLRQQPQDLDAWDSYWRGWWHFRRYSKDEIARARLLFERAIELDPNFAWAYAQLAVAHCEDVMAQWSEDPVQSASQAEQAVRSAMALDDDDSYIHSALGIVCRATGQLDRAIAAFERGLRLDPSDAFTLYSLGLTLAMAGKPDQAIENVETAMRLSPKDSLFHMFLFAMSLAHFAAGRFEKAGRWAQRSLELNSEFSHSYVVLAASDAHLGRLNEARGTVQELLRRNPAFSLAGIVANMAGWDPVLAERGIDGLRKAGLPE
jgi:TolB-like protein/Tfp pilus assembly protein PilF